MSGCFCTGACRNGGHCVGRVTFGPESRPWWEKTEPTGLDLVKKIEEAAKHIMTAEEIFEQRVSWVHGQTGIDKEVVRRVLRAGQ